MSLSKKLLYLGFVLIPLFILVPKEEVDLFQDGWMVDDIVSSFGWMIGFIAAIVVYIIAYIGHVNRNSQADEKMIWKIGFIFFYFPVMLAYWWRYIRKA